MFESDKCHIITSTKIIDARIKTVPVKWKN